MRKMVLQDDNGYSEEFRRLNFQPSSYTNLQNKKQPKFFLTRDGFTALVKENNGKFIDRKWSVKFIDRYAFKYCGDYRMYSARNGI